MNIDIAKIRRLNEKLIENCCLEHYDRHCRLEDTSIHVQDAGGDPIEKFLNAGVIIGDFQGSIIPEEEGEKTVHFFEPDYCLSRGVITISDLETEFLCRRLSPVGIGTFASCTDYMKEVFEKQGKAFATYLNLGDCFYLARLTDTFDHKGRMGLYVKNVPSWTKISFGHVFAGIRRA